jgi:hypothetical protein
MKTISLSPRDSVSAKSQHQLKELPQQVMS